jgi:hypothetical protein
MMIMDQSLQVTNLGRRFRDLLVFLVQNDLEALISPKCVDLTEKSNAEGIRAFLKPLLLETYKLDIDSLAISSNKARFLKNL